MIKKWKISEVGVVLETIKAISDESYQRRVWVNQENPEIVDSYEDTTMYFLEEAEPIIRDPSNMDITAGQYKMLKKLYEMVDLYDDSQERPERDKDIVSDPKWEKIREYAKLVYKELTK